MMSRTQSCCLSALLLCGLLVSSAVADETEKRAADRQQRISDAIKKVLPAYAFIGSGGSGVIISADGLILTNDHVAGRAWVHRIRTMDGTSRTADLIGTDPRGDVSLLKIRGVEGGMPFLEMGDASALKVGETVIAIGNPFGMGNVDENPTVTVGIVSTLHRFQNNYTDAIMTDAPINPGNSGGPLISMQGKLVGINGQIATRFGVRANSGIGYAITINQIQHFMKGLKEAKGGYVQHGRIPGLGLPSPQDNVRPPRVVSVLEGSAAEKAGFKDDDEILEVNGRKIITVTRFRGVVGTYPAGTTLEVKVKRDDKVVTLTPKLAPLGLPGPPNLRASFSGTASNLTVDAVAEDGPAAKAKVMKGDQLFTIAGISVAALLMQARPRGNPAIIDQLVGARTSMGAIFLELTVIRGGKKVPLVLDMERGTRSLGVTLAKTPPAEDLKPEQIQERDLKIISLVEGCALQRAGLKVGDILTALADNALPDLKALGLALRGLKAGQLISLEYKRGGKKHKVEKVVVDMRR